MINKKTIFWAIFTISMVSLIIFFGNYNKKEEKALIQNNKSDILKVWKKDYPYRKYLHIKKFYEAIAKGTIKICLKYNVPPAAILAMAGVESGYGQGYISKITGNILSLGAQKNEAMLPALYLPNIINFPSKVLYNPENINKYKATNLYWSKRTPSFKKDYRPKNIAGSKNKLDYFDNHPKQRLAANLADIEDFCKNWINKNKKQKAFVVARKMLDNIVKKKSKDVLFTKELNIKFINMIGGKKNSFNYRKTWPKKIALILKKTGLVNLVESLHATKKNFNELW
ncbi:MAG: glucosaminidase domain-containing protein [Epsilonproteobacteria bacterium]|nr:glucosaminidase domain-containing protein [Campylobacterota bacterium]